MTELQILSAIKNNGGSIEFTSLLNLNMTDTKRDILADKARIKQMIEKGLLEGKADAFSYVSISDRGRLYLQNAQYLEEQQQKLANYTAQNEAKKNRHDWYIAIISGLIAGLIGIVAEFFYILFK